MKNWFERIAGGLALIGGYALMAVVYLVVLLLAGYALIELITRTIYEPSPWLYAADAAAAILIIFLITRKSLRSGLKELWKQISRNM